METTNDTTATTTKKTRDERTVQRQICTNARKYLSELAAKRAKETGEYVAPTDEELALECKKRWQERLDRMKGKEDVSVYFL